jgi:hypothetical protein
VSLFGARLAVERALGAGSAVAVGLEATGEARPDLVTAEVIWCDPCDNGYHIGVHFHQPLASAFLQAL